MAIRKWNRWLTGVLGIALALGLPALSVRGDDTPTPSTKPPAALDQRGRPGLMIERMVESMGKLELRPEQQVKAKELFDETRKQLQALRESAGENPDRQAMAEKARDIFTNTRNKLAEILTPEQQEKLRDLMQQAPAGDPAGRPKPPEEVRVKTPPASDPNEMKMEGGTKKTTVTKAAVVPTKTYAAIDPGQPAPEFSLQSVGGKPVALSSLKGRVIVLVFGSYSTPSFRERVPAMEKMAKDYGVKAAFYVVYTREAHAVGEWDVDRNKEEKISVEQPKTEADRLGLAKQAVSTLKITLPVLIDGMDDAVAQSYGLAPNGAVVIGRDGKVVARQHWFEPVGLKAQLDAAIAAKIVKE